MKTGTARESTTSDMKQIEFFRQGMALLPEPLDKRPGVAFFVPGDDFHPAQRFCTCALSENRTCPHLKRLTKTFRILRQKSPTFEARFRSSWYRLAVILGETLVHYFSSGTDRARFLERCGSPDSRDAIPHRGWALTRLSDITRTDTEKIMNAKGFKTRKQALEASFWYRCAYHCPKARKRWTSKGTTNRQNCSINPVEQAQKERRSHNRQKRDATLERAI